MFNKTFAVDYNTNNFIVKDAAETVDFIANDNKSQRLKLQVLKQMEDGRPKEQADLFLADRRSMLVDQLGNLSKVTKRMNSGSLTYLLPVLMLYGLKSPLLKCANQVSAAEL